MLPRKAFYDRLYAPENFTPAGQVQGEQPAPGHLLTCQQGGDLCRAGQRDGVTCPEDSCDIDDGLRAKDESVAPPADALPGMWDASDLSGGETDCEPPEPRA